MKAYEQFKEKVFAGHAIFPNDLLYKTVAEVDELVEKSKKAARGRKKKK